MSKPRVILKIVMVIAQGGSRQSEFRKIPEEFENQRQILKSQQHFSLIFFLNWNEEVKNSATPLTLR